jgi:anti-sigma B factor antagonist
MTVIPRPDVAVHVPACFVVITAARPGEAVTLAVHGDLDRDSAPTVRDALISVVSTYQPSRVTIDGAEMDFCDCAGARMLAEVHREIAARGATCVACNLQPHVAWLMNWMQGNPRPAARYPVDRGCPR